MPAGEVEQILTVKAVNIGQQRVVVQQLAISIEMNQKRYNVIDTSPLSWAHSTKLPAALLQGDPCELIQRACQIARALLDQGFSNDSEEVSLMAFCSDTTGGEYYSDPMVLTPREMTGS